MKISLTLFIFTLILVHCFAAIRFYKKKHKDDDDNIDDDDDDRKGNETKRCRDSVIHNQKALDIVKGDIIDLLWGTGVEEWSPLVTIFKIQLQKHRSSKEHEVESYAELNVILLSVFNPYIALRPSICSLTTVINGSISCISDGNNVPIYDEITNGTVDSFYGYLINLAYLNGVNASKCVQNSTETIEVPTWECYKRGFVYDIQKIWDLRGQNIPAAVRSVVENMYRSKDCRDNFVAAIATYSLLSFSSGVHSGFDPFLLYEFLYLQHCRPAIEHCCDERVARLASLRDSLTANRKARFEQLGKLYSTNEICVNSTVKS